MKKLILFSLIIISSIQSIAQSSKISNTFDTPIIVDSNSTLLIPVRYDSDFISSSKITLWGNFYSNIIFYDFKNDKSKKLFPADTYIFGFDHSYYSYKYSENKNTLTRNCILYKVKNVDLDANGKIENNDPTILYVSDQHGNDLKALTSTTENVLTVDVFENQNIAMVKIQRDKDQDKSFEKEDKDYYMVKLDLTTLEFGTKIELK